MNYAFNAVTNYRFNIAYVPNEILDDNLRIIAITANSEYERDVITSTKSIEFYNKLVAHKKENISYTDESYIRYLLKKFRMEQFETFILINAKCTLLCIDVLSISRLRVRRHINLDIYSGYIR